MTKRRAATLTAALGALGMLACVEPKDDPMACQIGFGFGSYGCAEVSGYVRNGANQPVANAVVSSGSATTPFDITQTSSDATGAFRLRLDRRWLAQTASSDTVSAWVFAVTPAPPQAALARDSALVLLTFYPLRKRPVAAVITLHLSVP